MKKNSLLISALALTALFFTSCRTELYVQEEQGYTFEKITDENVDQIVRPKITIGNRYGNVETWAQYLAIDASKDGQSLGFVAQKNHNWNIFIRPVGSHSTSMQRTYRNIVTAFCYSPNSENICFSELADNGHYQLYITNAKQGSSIQKISPDNVSDFAPRYSTDGKRIFFERWNGLQYSIWSYDLAKGTFYNHCYGECPFPINDEELICTRRKEDGHSSIWKINYVKGTEIQILSHKDRSFTTPSVSPDGKWILFVSSVKVKRNFLFGGKNQLDVFVVPSDGSAAPTQLTFDHGNDYSPVWSADGKFIYYISQRGTKQGDYNIWKINFPLYGSSIRDNNDNSNYNNKNNNDDKKNKSSLPKKVGK